MAERDNIDSSVFAASYAKDFRSVFGFNYSQTGDTIVAEDLTQEAFTVTWEKLLQGSQIDSIAGYARNASRNIHTNWFRKNRHIEEDPIEDMQIVSREPPPPYYVEQTHLRESLYEALHELNSREFEVVRLHFVDGMDIGEIAKLKGKSEGAISLIQNRAFAKIRGYLIRRGW